MAEAGDAARARGYEPDQPKLRGVALGAAAIIDRGGASARIEVPLFSLVRLEVPTYQPDACPLCAKDIPVVKPGSRAS